MDSKRAFDLALGSLGLAAASPILAGVIVAMRLSGDRGPILHRARRMGEGGRILTVLKVRTMVVTPDGPRLTGPDDPRVTRLVGSCVDTVSTSCRSCSTSSVARCRSWVPGPRTRRSST